MIKRQSQLLFIAALIGFLCVAFGAFGAHALGDHLSEAGRSQYELGIRYAFLHALAILAAGLALPVASRPERLYLAAWFLVMGVILFSGSLLLLALTGIKLFAVMTPVGGVSLLAGWGVFAYSVIAKS